MNNFPDFLYLNEFNNKNEIKSKLKMLLYWILL